MGLVLASQRSTGRLDLGVHSGFQVLYTISKSVEEQSGIRYGIMNHDSGFIIGIAMVFFAKTLIEHTPKSHLKKHPSA